MKIAGVVILYNPDIEDVLKNIKTYLDKIDLLYVIDNSSIDHKNYFAFSEKLLYKANMENFGVARALNQAALMAIDDGFDYLLTMDQDSFFSEESIDEYSKIFNRLSEFSESAIIGISPKIFDPTKKPLIDSSYEYSNLVITSGSLVNLKIYKTVGGFNEKLFIDCVDYDYCLSLILAGFNVLHFKNIILYHIGGDPKFFLGIHVGMYSPERLYFISRNSFYLWKKYFNKFFVLIIKNIFFTFIFSFFPNILFSTNKKKSFSSILKGFKDSKMLFKN